MAYYMPLISWLSGPYCKLRPSFFPTIYSLRSRRLKEKEKGFGCVRSAKGGRGMVKGLGEFIVRIKN